MSGLPVSRVSNLPSLSLNRMSFDDTYILWQPDSAYNNPINRGSSADELVTLAIERDICLNLPPYFCNPSAAFGGDHTCDNQIWVSTSAIGPPAADNLEFANRGFVAELSSRRGPNHLARSGTARFIPDLSPEDMVFGNVRLDTCPTSSILLRNEFFHALGELNANRDPFGSPKAVANNSQPIVALDSIEHELATSTSNPLVTSITNFREMSPEFRFRDFEPSDLAPLEVSEDALLSLRDTNSKP